MLITYRYITQLDGNKYSNNSSSKSNTITTATTHANWHSDTPLWYNRTEVDISWRLMRNRAVLNRLTEYLIGVDVWLFTISGPKFVKFYNSMQDHVGAVVFAPNKKAVSNTDINHTFAIMLFLCWCTIRHPCYIAVATLYHSHVVRSEVNIKVSICRGLFHSVLNHCMWDISRELLICDKGRHILNILMFFDKTATGEVANGSMQN